MFFLHVFVGVLEHLCRSVWRICTFSVPSASPGRTTGHGLRRLEKKKGGIPSVLTEVTEHSPHQCYTTARSFLLMFSKVCSGIRDLQLSGAFLALTKPMFLLEPAGTAGSSGAWGGIASRDADTCTLPAPLTLAEMLSETLRDFKGSQYNHVCLVTSQRLVFFPAMLTS